VKPTALFVNPFLSSLLFSVFKTLVYNYFYFYVTHEHLLKKGEINRAVRIVTYFKDKRLFPPKLEKKLYPKMCTDFE